VVVPIKMFESSSVPKELNWIGMRNTIKVKLPIKKPTVKPIRYDDLKVGHPQIRTKT